MTETTQVTQAELLPCPFCGADAELERGNDHHGHWFNLGCSRHWGRQRNPDHTNTCIAGRMFYTETDVPEAEAITAWNTRIEAARPVQSELVEADLDWLRVASIAGEHGIRYRTNKALVQFLNALAALKETDKP